MYFKHCVCVLIYNIYGGFHFTSINTYQEIDIVFYIFEDIFFGGNLKRKKQKEFFDVHLQDCFQQRNVSVKFVQVIFKSTN